MNKETRNGCTCLKRLELLEKKLAELELRLREQPIPDETIKRISDSVIKEFNKSLKCEAKGSYS